jgi:hypothetical protein
MAFLLLYLMLDQRSQTRVHAELDALGLAADQPVGLAERPRLPFVQAVINVSF